MYSKLESEYIVLLSEVPCHLEGEMSQQRREELEPETVGALVMGKVRLYSMSSTTTAAVVTTTDKTDLSPTNQCSSTNQSCVNKGTTITTRRSTPSDSGNQIALTSPSSRIPKGASGITDPLQVAPDKPRPMDSIMHQVSSLDV